MHICVLGAGIVGLASAYSLHQQGHRITVVDQAGTAGTGASAGNGAQLSYSYVQPLADPAIWRMLPKLLLQADSPLTFRLQADPAQWAWMLRFMAACTTTRSHVTTRALLALAAQSRLGYEHMLATTGVRCDFAAPGKLVLLPTEAALAAARQQVALQAQLGGAPQHILRSDEAVAVEPSLRRYAPQFTAAVHTPSECVIDAMALCQQLASWLQARGVTFIWNTRALGWITQGDRAIALRSAGGNISADQFVVSTGWRSTALLRQAGETVPVYPLKGYSITVPLQADNVDWQGAAPRVSVTDSARKVVFARLGTRLRVAGMVELVGPDESLDAARIASLKASTAAVFPDLAEAVQHAGEACAPWTGMRPATPTGLPITRRTRLLRNLWVNTGHGALGVTLAFGSAAELVAAMQAETR
ncbi:amino acid dehydrogenase [Lampropedia cohaerens]|uniref:Amino acid dehydrogenase n=1 Tax=Lampropedia cohaerens TaxID=1610491 RepID=A0A0U1PWI2_9BURK|nr:D-amino acid dehydrogenase [Lampropedia cohaerens]KKW66816.1 amino acid dehydrogenase [Lampropedia cohaerens]